MGNKLPSGNKSRQKVHLLQSWFVLSTPWWPNGSLPQIYLLCVATLQSDICGMYCLVPFHDFFSEPLNGHDIGDEQIQKRSPVSKFYSPSLNTWDGCSRLRNRLILVKCIVEVIFLILLNLLWRECPPKKKKSRNEKIMWLHRGRLFAISTGARMTDSPARSLVFFLVHSGPTNLSHGDEFETLSNPYCQTWTHRKTKPILEHIR